MFKALKRLKLWQVAVLIVVILGTAGALYSISSGVIGSNSSAVATNIRTVPVQNGNLVKSVSASGSLVFPIRASLTFGRSGTGSLGTVTAVNVKAGQRVSEGEVLAQLGTTDLKRAVTKAEVNLTDAQMSLDKLLNPKEIDVIQARGAVRNAQVALDNANRDLDSTKLSADANIEKAEASLSDARATYANRLSLYQGTPSSSVRLSDVQQAAVAVSQAEKALELAQQAKPKLISNAENAVAQAEDTLKRAELTLQDLLDPDPQDLLLLRNQVTVAQVALDEVQENLKMATMVAPFAGSVASVNVKAGQAVGADTVAIEVVDPSAVELSAILVEIDISGVKPGQKATISLDAFPGLRLSGELSAIAAIATVKSGVVSYPVTVQVTLPPGLELREGMSATASIVTEEKNGVLLVPNQAIGGSSSKPVVKVMVGGKVEERQVKLGISNNLQTEVVEGLKQGDVVVIQTAAGTTTTTQPRSAGGIPGGGMLR